MCSDFDARPPAPPEDLLLARIAGGAGAPHSFFDRRFEQYAEARGRLATDARLPRAPHGLTQPAG